MMLRFLGVLALLAWVAATPSPLRAAPASEPSGSALYDDHPDATAFLNARRDADKAGVSLPQQVEAQLVYGIQTRNTNLIAQALNEIDPAWPADAFAKAESREQFEVIRHFGEATLHATREDRDAFSASLDAAGAADRSFALAFADWLEAVASERAMRDVRLPMDLPLAQAEGGNTTLADLAEGKKAVLLDFWASWCGPCIASFPELEERGQSLPERGIAVAGVNTESDADIARSIKKRHNLSIPWLIEPEDGPLSKKLMINSIPRAILVAPDGSVLFNGHPSDPALDSKIASIAK